MPSGLAKLAMAATALGAAGGLTLGEAVLQAPRHPVHIHMPRSQAWHVRGSAPRQLKSSSGSQPPQAASLLEAEQQAQWDSSSRQWSSGARHPRSDTAGSAQGEIGSSGQASREVNSGSQPPQAAALLEARQQARLDSSSRRGSSVARLPEEDAGGSWQEGSSSSDDGSGREDDPEASGDAEDQSFAKEDIARYTEEIRRPMSALQQRVSELTRLRQEQLHDVHVTRPLVQKVMEAAIETRSALLLVMDEVGVHLDGVHMQHLRPHDESSEAQLEAAAVKIAEMEGRLAMAARLASNLIGSGAGEIAEGEEAEAIDELKKMYAQVEGVIEASHEALSDTAEALAETRSLPAHKRSHAARAAAGAAAPAHERGSARGRRGDRPSRRSAGNEAMAPRLTTEDEAALGKMIRREHF
mmetsp:Transcript_55314/g.160553  ORF Transcript_55314/g.160553 Transcript_55314/m.160553 type:complete len:413 (-) Transcript_55314:57-1295(-)|eukprot:CAMPEP_0170256882 /NCGR_PEP_ID=MMETSP0116_2-20130129/28296_1 /TAXON_ID=400756 /ORGANISM="Durinskia baltica, Strain CSIRO CS-38" /LENGTH=412 /DNA_ID=CAMNT_0010507895 /DNA_START=85 /DNA_END=1323 /DNA_ORIENTATION=+